LGFKPCYGNASGTGINLFVYRATVSGHCADAVPKERSAVVCDGALFGRGRLSKADIIYINEAEGVACVAQGLTGQDWGKQEAPANKASDLNTAAAWLLQRPIEEVPDAVRGHAKLLRDGLEKKTINKLVFAYAHNALESHNVEAELETVRHLLGGLNITKDVEVDVVELGLRRIEALYLTSLGSIQVADEIDLPAQEKISESGPKWKHLSSRLKVKSCTTCTRHTKTRCSARIFETS